MISYSLFYFLDTTEQKDIERVEADNTFLNYELQTVVHLEKCLDYSITSFSTKLSRDDETKLFACNIIPCLKPITESSKKLREAFEKNEELNCILGFHLTLQSNFKKCIEVISELRLPNICPRVLTLTDAGPGVGISNYEQRYRRSCTNSEVRL